MTGPEDGISETVNRREDPGTIVDFADESDERAATILEALLESRIDPSSSPSTEGEPVLTPTGSTSTESTVGAQANQTPHEKLELALSYLRDGNDTSKFIGLSQLRSILFNNRELGEDQDVIVRCSVAIPPRFLYRILGATDYRGERTLDRDYMIGLAVAIIHTFPSLLLGSSENDLKFVDQIPRLLAALKIRYVETAVPTWVFMAGSIGLNFWFSPPETNAQILEILVMLASTTEGPPALLKADDWLTLSELAVQHGIVLQLIKLTYAAAFTGGRDVSVSPPKLHETMSVLANAFLDTADKTPLFHCFLKLVSHIPKESSEDAPWLSTTTRLFLESTTIDCASACPRMTDAAVMLAASLIKTFPTKYPMILFASEVMDPVTGASLSFRFVELRLIKLSSSIPYLIQRLHELGEPEHTAILSERLTSCYDMTISESITSCYDILSAFVAFYVQWQEDDHPSEYPYARGLVLNLERGLLQTCRTTVLYLCKRYDTTVAYAALGEIASRNSQAGAPTTGPSQMGRDPLTIAQLRMLALWLTEDEEDAATLWSLVNVETLHVVLGLYGEGDDIRVPSLAIMAEITCHSDGVDNFHHNNGWKILFDDLESIVGLSSPPEQGQYNALRIINILHNAVTNDIGRGSVEEHWMDAIHLACKLDSEGSVRALDVKYHVATLGTYVYTMSLHHGLGGKAEILKQLLEVVKKLHGPRDRLAGAVLTVMELEHAMKALRFLRRNGARAMVLRLPRR